jgi:hypothetical protein
VALSVLLGERRRHERRALAFKRRSKESRRALPNKGDPWVPSEKPAVSVWDGIAGGLVTGVVSAAGLIANARHTKRQAGVESRRYELELIRDRYKELEEAATTADSGLPHVCGVAEGWEGGPSSTWPSTYQLTTESIEDVRRAIDALSQVARCARELQVNVPRRMPLHMAANRFLFGAESLRLGLEMNLFDALHQTPPERRISARYLEYVQAGSALRESATSTLSAH